MSSSESDFKQLRQLLACKRHESPPPGYFRHFSDRVIARIEVEEFRRSRNWWLWLKERFEARPVLACAYGLAVSGLLLAGYRLSGLLQVDENALPLPMRATVVNHSAAEPAVPGSLESIAELDRPVVASTSSLSPAFRLETRAGIHVMAASFSPSR